MNRLMIAGALMLGLAANTAQAKLNVFTCEPEWGSLLNELAGDKIDVTVGTSALQDVHQIEAKPSLIAKVRAANLVVCTGAELEIGWLPQLLKQSGNQAVASGPGSFSAASQVITLEKPTKFDRAAGDVPRLIRAAHSLRGVASNVGAVTLQYLCSVLERGTLEAQAVPGDASACLAALHSAWSKPRPLLENWR